MPHTHDATDTRCSFLYAMHHHIFFCIILVSRISGLKYKFIIFLFLHATQRLPVLKNELVKTSNIGKRHTQVLLITLLMFISYGMRISMSVAIVSMTSKGVSSNPDVPIYIWNDKSIVLSAFFWGYTIPQIPAGWLAAHYGAKWFLVVNTVILGILSILLPLTADLFGSKGVMVNRAIQGFCQGFTVPSLHYVLGHWVPSCERARSGSFAFAGGPLGNVAGLIMSGSLSASWLGWPWIFYIYGVIAILWSVLSTFFSHNTPGEHPFISEAEKLYIENSLGQRKERRVVNTPWKAIFGSIRVWAIIVAQFGNNWGYWLLLTQIPTYMSGVMKYSMKRNSLLSALPYMVLWIMSFVASWTCDFLINRQYLTLKQARKAFNTFASNLPALALVGLAFTPAMARVQAVVLLVLTVGLNSAHYSGFCVNHVDISPNHASTIMGITNEFGNLAGIIGPVIVHYVVTDEGNPEQWKIIWLMCGAVYVLGNLFFISFATADVQPWNDNDDDDGKCGSTRKKGFPFYLSFLA